jgi:hypothetical protein
MVTVLGTFTEGSLSVNATTTPPAGAAPFSVTVPVDALPPTTEVGFRVMDATDGGLTVNIAWLVPL